MESNLKIIKDACIKANPDILKLEYGCVVEMTDSALRGHFKFYPRGVFFMETTLFDVAEVPGGGHRSLANDYIAYHPEKFRILGRPIRLADVLVAIRGEKQIILSDADEEMGVCFGEVVKGDTRFDDKLEVNWSLAFWNLRDDVLDHQSPETIQFLAELLK